MNVSRLVKRLAVVTGISTALTAWRNVMLSINERQADGNGPTADGRTPDGQGPDITLPPK